MREGRKEAHSLEISEMGIQIERYLMQAQVNIGFIYQHSTTREEICFLG